MDRGLAELGSVIVAFATHAIRTKHLSQHGDGLDLDSTERVNAWDDIPATDDHVLQPFVHSPRILLRERDDVEHELRLVTLLRDEPCVFKDPPLSSEPFNDLWVFAHSRRAKLDPARQRDFASQRRRWRSSSILSAAAVERPPLA